MKVDVEEKGVESLVYIHFLRQNWLLAHKQPCYYNHRCVYSGGIPHAQGPLVCRCA